MNNERILVVDDEDEVRKSLVRFLERKGYRTGEARSGVEALQYVQKYDVDLVLLDINMPGFDGLETLSAVRKANPKASVIMLTALKDEEKAKTALSLGALHYILKPFDFERLQILVSAAIFVKRSKSSSA